MGRLFPLDSPFSDRDPEPAVFNLDEADGDAVLDTLGSDTARQLLAALYEEPRTMSDLAEISDTSVQNVEYHLRNFEDAGLVEPVDTLDSEQGRAVTVWAPSQDPLVVMAGSTHQTSRLREVFERLVGTVGILALASVLIELVARELTPRGRKPQPYPPSPTPTPSAEAQPGMPVGTPTNTTATPLNETATPTLQTPTREVGEGLVAGGIPPGFLFFAGGLFVLFVVLVWRWYHHSVV